MIKFIWILVLSQLALFGSTQYSDFDGYQGKWTRGEVEERLGLFLQKEGRVASYFSIDQDQLVLYNLPDTQKDREIEYTLKFAHSKTKFEPKQRRKNFVGVKIAIDPGHFGGPYAKLEERYIDIPPSLEREDCIQFDEGTLSLLTAKYLKILLEKEGAIVLLTREEVGKGVYEDDFFAWLKKNPSFWGRQQSLYGLFRKYFNPLDLRARADKINAFAPDLSIMIHYNSHHADDESSSNHTPCSGNFNMAFIPGAFCRGELAEFENRYEFMRLLVTEDLKNSLHLSRCIVGQFSKHLRVPLVTKADNARYLETVCIEAAKGVYARNLALTRLVHSPICYGETLVQNNIDECVNLSKTDFVIGGQKCSSRIKQVAEAYFEGIKHYLMQSE
ncbi:MAG: N-acetylmuramoyl-L-alanine amidase [Simkaniaceae bacterium]|nr:N-acetylmuramoyl-L-alanine amidase [Candidatus Sacchlamyda saccharinae]